MKAKSLFAVFLSVAIAAFSGCHALKRTLGISNTTVTTAEIETTGAGGNQKPSNYRMFFWEVTSKDGKQKIYLLGSVHIGKDDMFPLNNKIMNAFNECDSLALECDVLDIKENTTFYEQTKELYKYKDGSKIQDHISKNTYQKCREYLKSKGKYEQKLDNYRPAYWKEVMNEALVEEGGYSYDIGVDMYFTHLAKERKMEILEVEEERRAEMFRQIEDPKKYGLYNFHDDYYEIEIANMIKYKAEYIKGNKTIVRAVQSGDIDLLEQYIFDDTWLTGEEKLQKAAYNKVLLDDRNPNMADKAAKYLKEGKKCFYIVGAAHMIGDSGVVKQLKKKGYNVKQVAI